MKPKRGNELIDVDEALGFQLPDLETSYQERDLILYALGVGAGNTPHPKKDLQLVYENHSDGFRPLATYGVVPAVNALFKLLVEGQPAPGLHYGLERVLHGEQYLEVLKPIPLAATLRHSARISNIFDKGKHALVVTHIDTFDVKSGELLFRNDVSMIIRGAGGWNGERGPPSTTNEPPSREPDIVALEKTADNQALLYRLSGDLNPLHVDPDFAGMFSLDKPILHGLCTFGFVGRAVIDAFAQGDPRRFKSMSARFAEPVFPGETLKIEMWQENVSRVLVRASVVERAAVVISHAAVVCGTPFL